MTLVDRIFRPRMVYGVESNPRQTRVAVARTYNTKKGSDDAPNVAAWQTEAWRVWERLGEIHYPTTQIARLISRLDWNTDPEFDLEDFFANPGLAEITRVLALNLIVGGEGWLCTQLPPDPMGDTLDLPVESDTEWRVYAVVEPNLKSKLAKTGERIRVWTPDPRNSNSADSGVRAAISPALELIALQDLSLSQIYSRIASNGILLRPNTRTPLVDENGEPVDFAQVLHDAMAASIADVASPSALTPIDIEVPADEIEFWKHLTFERPYDERVDERMERVIRRIALALDIWPELLLGVADINHWGSWFLSEDTWRASTAPLAMQVAQAMEVAVDQVTNRKITIEPDPAVLLARRSSVRDALNAAWIGGVGLKYIREVIGATEEDAPSTEELDIIRIMAGQRRSESRAGLTAGEEEEITPAAEGDSDAILGAFGDLTGNLGVDLVRVDDQLKGWLEGAVSTSVTNIRGQVGARLRRALRGNPKLVLLDGVDNTKAAAAFGVGVYDHVEVDPVIWADVKTLTEEWARVLTRAEQRITELVGPIFPPSEWENARRRSVEILGQLVYEHVSTTLTNPTVPFLDLTAAVTAAGLDG